MSRKNKYPVSPPHLATRFLRWYCRAELVDEVEGDLYELFQRRIEEQGLWRARILYWINILMFLHPDHIRKRKESYTLNHTDMFRNYFKVAIRQYWKQKGYALLNILGLTIGLTTSLLILLWVQHELSYDTMHTKADRIYVVNANFETAGTTQTWTSTPAALGAFAKTTIPDIEQVVRITDNNYLIKYEEKTFTDNKVAFVDASFFTVFDFKLLKGNLQNPFPDLKSVILTESAALKYFGEPDPIGKVIQTDKKEDYVVSGIIEDFPGNSSINYDLLFPFEILINKYKGGKYWKSMETDWGNYGHETYLLMQPTASLKNVEAKITQLHHDNHPISTSQNIYYTTQPLKNIHLYASDGSEAGMQEVRIFFIVALVILLIACINYVNLSTARATKRAKEVSLRKLIGASKTELFGQLMGESALLFIIASVLSLFAAELLMPVYNHLSGKSLEFNALSGPVLMILGGAFLFTLLTAGIYPAVLLSAFEPQHALKGKFSIGKSNISFRKMLVVTQFIFSIVLIVGTLIISQQMQYIREKNLGYERENTFTFGMRDMYDHYEAVKAELEKLPEIMAVTSANQRLVNITNTTGDTDWDGKVPDRLFIIHPISIDENFLETMNVELVAGRNFTGSPADSAHLILNETAIAQAGIEDPIGKRFKVWGIEGTIIGIAKDFHFASIHQKIEPAVFHYDDKNWVMYIKTTGEHAAGAIAAVEKFWKQYNPDYPFEYRFLDEMYDVLYKSDQRTSQLFNYFTGIAILVSCLGLFGLATFTAEQRTKEIGIRKVLGASVPGIVALLSKDFLRLVLVAVIIASPVAWYVMRQWLQNFAYKIEITAGVFILSGLAALLIAWLTVSYQSVRAAMVNPVDSLRNE